MVTSDYFWHLNFTDCFGGEGFAINSNNSLQALSKPSLLFSHYLPQTRTRIALAEVALSTPPAMKSLSTF